MKKYFLSIVLMSLFACKAQQKHSELGFSQELKKTFTEASDECLKDILTFEDDYLGKVKDLDGYSWNQKNTTATLKISEEKILEIQIRGCEPTIRICKFIVSNNFILEDNSNQIVEDFLWISNLILNKKEYKKFNRDINKLSINNSNKENNFEVLNDVEKLKSFIAFYEENGSNKTDSIIYLFK